MKNIILKSIFLGNLLVFSALALSQTNVHFESNSVKLLSVINPPNNNGVQIGDVLNRIIKLEIDAAYTLPKTALPIKGLRRSDIELINFEVQTVEQSNRKLMTILLQYQVFATSANPIKMQLPPEQFSLNGGEKPMTIDIPAWSFWYSPLVPENVLKAKSYLQPQAKATLLDVKMHQIGLYISLFLLIIGALGFIYVNASKGWLPFMSGAFAKTYRKLKNLDHDEASYKQGLMFLHEAFNQTYGTNLFANELDQFFDKNQNFIKIRNDIFAFYEQSNLAIFTKKNQFNQEYIQDLVLLSKRLRDCERGL